VFCFFYVREQSHSSGHQLQHNSAYAFDTDMRPSQPDQGQVNIETHISNKPSLHKTPKKEMSWENTKNLEK
jgi:hypothetical protein